MSSGAGPRHLARLAEAARERHGDAGTLHYAGEIHESPRLFARARHLAGGLAELGLAPGERVVVCMANCPEVSIAYHALWRAGLVATPATFLLPAPELRHIMADSGARAVLTTPEFLEKVAEAASGLPELRHLICAAAPPDGPAALDLAELESAAPRAIVDRDEDDLAALLYTGGTTGRAKGVMLSHASLVYTGAAAHRSAHDPAVDTSLVTLPLSHAYGLLITVAGLHAPEPGSTVLHRWFDADAFLRDVTAHRVQSSALVPTMLQRLLTRPLEEHDLSSLRHVTSGAAPLPPEIARAFARRLPGVQIRQGYGMTETAALISSTPVGSGREGAAGRPVPGTEVEIRDRAGAALAPGEIGEVCVRSPGLMRGYWRAPEGTAQAIRDGWLHTGDVGYLDAAGWLFIVDRQKDLIIRGGFNVYPRDVEDALTEHPEVRMAGVVGAPSERHGEEVVAFVALAPDATLTAAALRDWSRERLGGYRYPREVHLVDAVPLTPVGKVDRKALRARLRELAP